MGCWSILLRAYRKEGNAGRETNLLLRRVVHLPSKPSKHAARPSPQLSPVWPAQRLGLQALQGHLARAGLFPPLTQVLCPKHKMCSQYPCTYGPPPPRPKHALQHSVQPPPHRYIYPLDLHPC